MEEILDEVQRLSDNGFREVVLTGIHLGHYGVDFNKGKPKPQWTRLANLVRNICESTSGTRVRLSSIEATEVTRELMDVMQHFQHRVCPHLHVCLQSGSDRILRKMKRRWTRRHIIDRCQQVKQQLHLPAFTTDVIVGFPGETEDDFQDTLDACRQIGFSKIHIFPFSARRGTPAAEMPDQIPKPQKAERGKRLADLEAQLQLDYYQSLIGQNLQLLVERIEPTGAATGTSCRYAQVRCDSPDPSQTAAFTENDLVAVSVDRLEDGILVGRRSVEI
jgi:threonylcarbamoyladenosine tRNA methylthiotransferase MtaB